jgi:hypothetical protein
MSMQDSNQFGQPAVGVTSDPSGVEAAQMQPQLEALPQESAWGRWHELSPVARITAAVGGLLLLGAAVGGGLAITSNLPWSGGGPGASGPASLSSPIAPVPPAEIGRAIALLTMADAEKAKVQVAVNSGKLKIGFVTVSDSDAEDGDWVSVSSGGFRQDVRLFKQPLVVAVPYLQGQPIRVTGLVDGDGGGITVAVHVGTNVVVLKPLQVGESVEVSTP